MHFTESGGDGKEKKKEEEEEARINCKLYKEKEGEKKIAMMTLECKLHQKYTRTHGWCGLGFRKPNSSHGIKTLVFQPSSENKNIIECSFMWGDCQFI